MEYIDNCPICKSTSFKKFLDVKDYANTEKKFEIVECENCSFHFTNPIPSEEDLKIYYKSFDYISHTSSNEGFINKLYNYVRKITLKNKISWIENEVCGGGGSF